MKLRIFNYNLFELSMISIVTMLSAIFFVQAFPANLNLSDIQYPMLELVAAFCGINSVVLCAKGKKSGFIFGLINVIGYSLISFNTQYYGEVMLNVFFYIPMNIISYITWSKHKDENRDKEVKARALSLKQILGAAAVIIALTICYHFALQALGGAQTMLDGASTILSIFATVLMMLRYAEQWALWIIIDAITVVLWVLAGDLTMITMWGVYLINAFYGYCMWLNKSGKAIPFKTLIDKLA